MAERGQPTYRSRSYSLRLILLGEAGSGKSCLYHRIKYKTFRDEMSTEDPSPPSIVTSRQKQYDQYNVQISLTPSVTVNLTIVDTADREKFQSLTAQYYRRTNIALLVCSLDDELSLNRLAKWQQEAQHYINDPEVLYAVCGTKSDLQTHEREVTTDMMHSFADHMEILQSCVFEISSKTGSEVKNMLKSLCSMTIERMMQQNTLEENSLINMAEDSFLLSSTNSQPLVTTHISDGKICKCCVLL